MPTYDYDINGAYGSELAKLVNLRDGKWHHTTDYSTAHYGFAKGILTTNADFHPFLLEGNDLSYTPVGSWETYLTINEIEFLKHYKLGKFEIEDMWCWIAHGAQEFPLRNLVEWLYGQKQSGNELEAQIARRCMAGIWGRFLEFRGKDFGPAFNPVYGAIVEANNRLKVARVCIENDIKPLHVAVDGVITDKPLAIRTNDELGGWRLSHKGKCIIVSSGVVGFEGKQGAEEFSLRFSWLYEQMKAKPGVTELTMEKWAPVTLAKALNTDFNELGQVKKLVRSVYLEPDKKRVWKDRPRNASEILSKQYQSAPLEASIIAKTF